MLAQRPLLHHTVVLVIVLQLEAVGVGKDPVDREFPNPSLRDERTAVGDCDVVGIRERRAMRSDNLGRCNWRGRGK